MEHNINEEKNQEFYDAKVYDGSLAYKAAEATAGNTRKSRRTVRSYRRRTDFGNGLMYKLMIEKGGFLFLLAFLIPAAIMTFAFAQEGVHPFGDRQILVVDLWHQYYPFFRVVREKLLTGGSFFYSWQNGMGSNFLSLISYYAMSPLNWISILFPEEGVRDAMTLTLIMKIGFSGAFFSCFLRYTYNRKDYSIVFFSVMYALCSFTLGYYWNTMWFDTVALFPLVMLGIVAICRERKWKTYTFALALSLIANYYIGFFTCIFSIFMFAAAGIIEFKGIKDLLYKLWLIIRSSILGIGLGGFILLPAYLGLKMTYSNDGRNIIEKVKYIFGRKTEFYHSWSEIFANTISYNEPTKVEGLPNFACGMLALVLFGVFFFSLRIKRRERIFSLLMLAFIAYSCNFNKINYIWHGFHFTNQIPYRYAFIFSFLLVAAAFRAYDVILRHGIKIYQLIMMLVVPFGVFALNYYTHGKTFNMGSAVKSSAIITGAYWLIFLAAKVFPFKKAVTRNVLLSLALSAAVFSEFVENAIIGVKTVSTTTFSSYPTYADEVDSLLNAAAKSDEEKFYRTEVTRTYTLNDSALYGYNGISQFSSAANVSVTRLSRRFGLYASEAGNRFYYRAATPVYNSMFGIKYLINKTGTYVGDTYSLGFSGMANSSYMYKNKFTLSLGYMVNEDILTLPDKDGVNPFEYQNDVLKLATGITDSCFTAAVPDEVEYKNMEVTQYGFGNYSYNAEKKGSVAKTIFTFNGKDGASLYGYASCTSKCVDDLHIECNKMIVDEGDIIVKYPLVFPMGSKSSADKSTVTVTAYSEHDSGNFKLMVYNMNHETFEEAYAKLADEQLRISEFSDTKISGSITAKESGVLFLSIPYEKGWRVYVDGKSTPTFSVLDAMLGVRVSAGDHTIRLEYVPEGFPVGIVVSTASAALIGFIIWCERKRRIRLAEAAEAEEEEYSDEPDYTEQNQSEIYDQETESPDSGAAVAETENNEENNEKPEGNDSVQGD